MLEVVLKGPGGSVHVLKHGRAVGARGYEGVRNTMVFYPTITNFLIVLILKSSEDLALIR